MDLFFRLFDLFIETARKLADYLPQSGSDVIQMFQQLGRLVTALNIWVADNIGISIPAIIAPLGKVIILGFNFLMDLLRQMVNRL